MATTSAARSRPDRPAAVLWDMDGTLVDTEPYWIAAETAVVEAHGRGWWGPEDAKLLVGNDLLVSGAIVRERGEVRLPVEEIVELLMDGVVSRIRQEVPWRPGAMELLATLRADHVPCALVTMSYERLVGPVLDTVPAGSFDVVVTGDNVAHGKPHPEPYLHAARLLGVEPTSCVAIEDSQPGAASAEAAGCRVLVVQNHVSVPPGPGRVFLPTLSGLTTADLARLRVPRDEAPSPLS
jgi:HAD superfamily hydrolase (TIGR01509 family)